MALAIKSVSNCSRNPLSASSRGSVSGIMCFCEMKEFSELPRTKGSHIIEDEREHIAYEAAIGANSLDEVRVSTVPDIWGLDLPSGGGGVNFTEVPEVGAVGKSAIGRAVYNVDRGSPLSFTQDELLKTTL
jgi:hypothetical protein